MVTQKLSATDGEPAGTPALKVKLEVEFEVRSPELVESELFNAFGPCWNGKGYSLTESELEALLAVVKSARRVAP
jgi:hypothetical protein